MRKKADEIPLLRALSVRRHFDLLVALGDREWGREELVTAMGEGVVPVQKALTALFTAGFLTRRPVDQSRLVSGVPRQVYRLADSAEARVFRAVANVLHGQEPA